MLLKKNALLPLIICFCFHVASAQTISYSDLFDNSTFSRSIDLSRPVGAIDGAAGTNPSGAATYTIPIKCPPGTNGVAPQLAVVYNSQGGNGLLGQGWSLSGLSTITRAGKDFYHDGKAGPVSYTNDDAFMLDGQRLVPTSGNNGDPGTTYRTEAQSYAVITSNETIGGGPRYFNVVAKDGSIMQYGYTDDARFVNDDDSKIMMWRLNKVQDVNGNYISFHYDNFDRDSRLVKISYTGNDDAGLSPYNEINFEYAQRSDQFLAYDGGNSFRSKYLLWQIKVKGEGGDLFKTYQFEYGKNKVGVSYLKLLEEFAPDNSKLNDTRFKYGEEVTEISFTESDLFVKWSNPDNESSTNYDMFSGDYDGDGKTEILRTRYNHIGATHYNDRNYIDFEIYKSSSVAGAYSVMSGSSTTLSTSTANYLSSYQRNKDIKGYNFVHSDFNGDGRDDILFMNITSTNTFNGVTIYYSNLGTYSPGFTKNDIPAAPLPAAHEMIGENILLTGDFDGDNRSDYVYMTRHTDPATGYKAFHTFVSFPGKGENNKPIMLESDFTKYDQVATGNIKNGGGSVISKVYILDFDGDGSSEIMCSLTDENIIYKLQKSSSGVYYFKKIMSGSLYPIERYQDIKGVGDFNGDGKSDLLINAKATRSNWEIAYSDGKTFNVFPFSFQAGKEYQQYCILRGTEKFPDDTNPDDLFISDFNGDGKSDILHKRAYCNSDYENKMDLIYYISNGGFSASSYTYPYKFSELVTPIITDENGDGKAELSFKKKDLLQEYMHTMYFNKGDQTQLLEKVTDGFNRSTQFIYDPLTKGGDIYTKGSGGTWPVNNAQYPLYVVTSLKTPDGIGGTSITAFRYVNLLLHRAGRGLLGFEKVRAINFTTGIETQTQYALNTEFYVPYLKSSKSFLSWDPSHYSQTTNNYNFTRIGSGYCFTQTNPSGSSEDLLSGRSSTYSNTYDGDGNITHATGTLNGDVTITTTTETNYTKVAGSPFFNAPADISVTTQRGSKPAVMDKTILEYDGNGRLIHSYTMPNGVVDVPNTVHKYWTYDGFGNKASDKEFVFSNPYIPLTSYEYDAKGRFMTRKTDKLGAYTEYTTHKFWGKPLNITGITGLTSSYTYDAWGKLRSSTVPVSSSASYTINYSDGWDPGTNQLYYTLVSDPSAPDVKTWYDNRGRTVKTQQEHSSGTWTNAWTRYDARGNVAEQSNTYLPTETPLTTAYAYDDRNRLSTQTTPTGTTNYAYSFSGGSGLTTVTLPDGKIKKSKTDAAGKLVESDNGIAGAVVFDYDSRGNELRSRMKIFSSGMDFVSKEYDQWGRLVRMDDADAGKTTYKYNAFGQLLEQKDPKGKTTYFTYESGLGRLQQKVLDGVTTTYTYYDKLKNYQLHTEAVNSSTYGAVTDQYDYTEAGDLALHSKNTNGVVTAKTFTYDAYGRPLVTEYSSGLGTRNQYDGYGFLQKITTNFSGGGSGEKMLYEANRRRGDGQIQSFTRSNGLVTEYSYEYGTLTRMQDLSGIHDQGVGYDFTNGNVWARADVRAQTQELFTYDAADRLTTSQAEKFDASGGSLPWPAINLKYDTPPSSSWTGSYGRIVSKSDAGTYQYAGFPRNAVASITDPHTLVNHGTQEITYTPFHKADQISEMIGVTAYEENFVYDAAGDRAYSEQKQGGAVQHRRWYMGDYELDRFTGAADQHIHYISGEGGLCAIVVKEGATFTYYSAYTDHLGSIVLLTDETGTPIYRQSYDPWGRERDPETWDHGSGWGTKPRWLTRGYTGHEMLSEYGLINMNGRMYDPLNGRMLRPDNYVQDPANTQSYNRYSYCLNNPMKYTDPSGELFWFAAPFLYAGMNLAFDMAQSGGKMDVGQIGISLAMGAIGGTLSGATSFGAAFIGATMSQISRSVPSIPLVKSENFNLSVSPLVGFGTSGFNVGASLNASGQFGDFAYAASVGAG